MKINLKGFTFLISNSIFLEIIGTEIIGTPIFFDITSTKTYNLYMPKIARVIAAEIPVPYHLKRELSVKDI